jgi:hypothetical protein
VYRVLVGKPEGKRPLGRPRRMGSKWALGRLVGGRGVEWIHLAQDRDHWHDLVSRGDELLGSGATELLGYLLIYLRVFNDSRTL